MNRWLPPSLWLLVRLRIGSAVRDGAQRIRTPGGFVTALLMVGFLGVWLVPLALLPPTFRPVNPGWMRAVGPLGLAMLWFGQVALRGGGEVLGFMPSEADQLFAAPYTPSQLLRYKVTLLVFAWTLGGLLMSPMAMFYAVRPVGGVLAAVLVLPFLQLSAMISALIREGGRRSVVGRAVFLLVMVGLAVAVAWMPRDQSLNVLDSMTALQATPVGRVVLFPFRLGASLLYAGTMTELALAAAGMFLVDVALATLLVALGRRAWLEIAADGAQHMAGALARYRSGGGVSALGGWWGARVPAFPRWGGAGTVGWRRTIEILRRPTVYGALGGVLVLDLVVGLGATLVDPGVSAAGQAIVAMQNTLVWGTVLLPGVLRMDFRSDLDRMDILLALPLRPWALFAGQVLPMVVVVTALGWTVDVLAVVWAPSAAAWALVLIALQPCAAAMVLCVDNALFLWLPVRTEAGEAALQSVGRNLMITFLGWTLIGGSGTVAALVAGLAVYLGAGMLPAALLATVPLLGVAAVAAWLGTVRLRGFDPSVHVPR
ncbi:MAG: hypothetical protein H6733_00795 [Alphaproteobacteria bacterium]|nr:hypothetical protein [Alphaproteobacteria bacterium]